MKPNLKFLQKVADGNVEHHNAYSPNRGAHYVFYGGEVTAQKHADAGYIIMPPPVGVMRSSKAKLTDLGRQVLTAAEPNVAADAYGELE